MPDQAAPGLLRIALVFGDETAASHVRDAMQGNADIVYATSATDFDAARMADAKAAAALVNLDDGDWLDGIESSLDATGIAVVYNDPEFSSGLDGWERARWLRHLLAKMRRSNDVDPPRPQQTGLSAGDSPVAAESEMLATNETGSAAIERPLSPQEIETMTADFVAIQETASVQVGHAAPQPGIVIVDEPAADDASVRATDIDSVQTQITPSVAADKEPAPVQIEAVGADTPPDPAVSPATEPVDKINLDSDGDLDVDTETLSAMIDARLADSKSGPSSDSKEVWRVVEGGAESSVHGDAPTAGAGETPSTSEPAEQKRVEPTAGDDADFIASLPSLEDWTLVDADAPSAPAPAPAASHEQKNIEPTLSDSIAGLELIPMDTFSVEIHSDPIERWLHEAEPAKPKATLDGTAKTASNGGKA